MRHTHTADSTIRNHWNAALLAGLIAVGTGSALAQATPPVGPSLGFGQISEVVLKQGYTEIREIERKSDKLYEIKALDSKGLRTKLYVDARTGEVLKVETKGRSRDGDRRMPR